MDDPQKRHRLFDHLAAAKVLCLFSLILGLFLPVPADLPAQDMPRAIESLLGANDAMLVAGEHGEVCFAKNIDKKLIPASTLKVLTAMAAIHYLGPDYRFPTEFYADKKNDLFIKGYGDPLLISETVANIAQVLKHRLDRVRDIVLDDSYFRHPIEIPGIAADTRQPYNAPNGALCVNFNTVNFETKDGRIVSAEPQTPMLPIALKRIREKKDAAAGRILLSGNIGDTRLYAGQLFRYFLARAGLEAAGGIRAGRVQPRKVRLIYRHASDYPLSTVIEKLFKYSNNYMANQILLAAGARVYDPPATLEKGTRLLTHYCRTELSINDIQVAEGSGISRNNRVSAKMLAKILDAFAPYYTLMPKTGRLYFKTGTLNGVHTRVGYIEGENRELYRFVILLNTKGKRTQPLISEINKCIP